MATPTTVTFPVNSEFVMVTPTAAVTVFPVYVTTDGSTPSSTNYEEAIPAAGDYVVGVNAQRPDKMLYAGSGGLNSRNGSGVGLTAQSMSTTYVAGVSGAVVVKATDVITAVQI